MDVLVRRVVLAALVMLGLSLSASEVRAQIFSPGPLAKPHSYLEGLSNCLKCHDAGNKLSNARCLECHAEIKVRVSRRSGFHGRLPKSQLCSSCHREHKGVERKLIDWEGPRSSFDHGRTGWPLKGSHGKAKCQSCHDSRRITDGAVKSLVRRKKRDTYLGLPTKCADCHFDEHRGQEGLSCERCHDERKFKKAPGFNHNKDSAFALTGRHRRVKCTGCHDKETDTKTPADAFPAPVSSKFLQLKDIPHSSCLDCHEDHHDGKMGTRCTSCHSTRGWKILNASAKDFGFHDKTRFPLKGMHASVSCKSCHGPFPGKRVQYKGIRFGRCNDCHMDAHVGQLDDEAPGKKGPDCRRCHSERGFVPTAYTIDDHAHGRYPLEGSHRAVACTRCHTDERGLAQKVPSDVRRELARKDRPVRVSLAKLRLPDLVIERCESCHKDPHDGQFEEKVRAQGCNACHKTSAFQDLLFDHDRDSRFALEGRHRGVACASCHGAEKKGSTSIVRYRPLEQACASCHADVHVGQFAARADDAKPGAHVDCARCHTLEGFDQVRFDHNDPSFSKFPLKGRHLEVSCERCHPKVEVRAGLVASWYRGVPKTCAGCHVDAHDGRFAGFEP